MKTNIHLETLTWSSVCSNHSASHSHCPLRVPDQLANWDLTWHIECRQFPKSVKCVRYYKPMCTFTNMFKIHKNCIHFYINWMHFYKKCVHLYNNKMCALLQKVRIQFFLHTYRDLLRFRPSNIKMLSTRLVMSPPPCLCFLSVWMAV